MMRKLLSVTLMTLVVGVWAAAHPAEAASYAGAASTRCCPVPQECGGHVEYQLQRQTVLQNVPETVYETQQVTCVRDVCETVMQPRTVTTMQDGRRAVGPRGPLHGPAARLPDGLPRGPLHGPAAGLPDGLEDADVHRLPAGPRDAPGDADVHGLPAGPRDRR